MSARGVPGRPHRLPRPGRLADVATARADAARPAIEALGSGDRRLRRQDRDADDQHHDGTRAGRRRVGPAPRRTAAARAVPRDRRVRCASPRRSTRSTRWTARSKRSVTRVPERHGAPARGLGARARVPAVGGDAGSLARLGARRSRDRYVIAAKGAPEAIADLFRHLDPDVLARQSGSRSRRRPAAGRRVLGVARASLQPGGRLPRRAARFRLPLARPRRVAGPGAPGRRRRGRRVCARRCPRGS